MSAETILSDEKQFVHWPRWFLRGLTGVAGLYLIWLAIMVGWRASFPWDLFVWPESPFMTNMVKLDLGQPLFGSPADGNSFVYSPGLEYLTFAVLKPLGLHLDIRFCRLVNIAIGLLAGGLAGVAVGYATKMFAPENRFPRFAWLGGGIAVLIIFKNFTADVTHPDNLVMFHTAGVFLLTLWAWRSKKFSVALATMVLAGSGVFAKQILLLAFLGPTLVFARFNPWGWRRWLLLVLVGVLTTAGALVLIAHTADAQFYLLKLLPRQGLYLTRLYWLMQDLFTGDRAFLMMLGLVAVGVLWNCGQLGRAYLQLWLGLGVFSVFPNVLSYLKSMGMWNNLIIFQLWLWLAVGPAIALWLSQASQSAAKKNHDGKMFHWTFAALLAVFVLTLFPPKLPAHAEMYAVCNEVQRQVTADVQAGRTVLVNHGMMYLLRAGSRAVPLDRVNSILELKVAGFTGRSKFPERLRSHYYDRIYLVAENWYPPEFLTELHRYYQTKEILPRPYCNDRTETGRSLELIAACQIMVPRPAARPAPEK